MNPASMQAQLYALRAQVDALILAVEADMPAAPQVECPHPHSQRRDLSVMGGPERWECQVCGHEQTEPDD